MLMSAIRDINSIVTHTIPDTGQALTRYLSNDPIVVSRDLLIHRSPLRDRVQEAEALRAERSRSTGSRRGRATSETPAAGRYLSCGNRYRHKPQQTQASPPGAANNC